MKKLIFIGRVIFMACLAANNSASADTTSPTPPSSATSTTLQDGRFNKFAPRIKPRKISDHDRRAKKYADCKDFYKKSSLDPSSIMNYAMCMVEAGDPIRGRQIALYAVHSESDIDDKANDMIEVLKIDDLIKNDKIIDSDTDTLAMYRCHANSVDEIKVCEDMDIEPPSHVEEFDSASGQNLTWWYGRPVYTKAFHFVNGTLTSTYTP